MHLSELHRKIRNKEARLSVIGLGYVGLPVACMFAKSGFDVLGVDINPDRVEIINVGYSPIEGDEPGFKELLATVVTDGKLHATTDYQAMQDQDVILIAVETPVNENNVPEYQALRSALSGLGPVMKTGSLLIVESTIAPGTMHQIVLPLLEQTSGKKHNQDFFLGNCPERVMPGKLLSNLQNVSRVVGGMTPEIATAMTDLYRHIVNADLDTTDCLTAELVKTTENTYRDVQIAFANEVALICEAVGGDVWKVRELVNKSPYRDMHLPGSGVGGHCIPKDPLLLAYSVKDKTVPLRLIPAAREINDNMPHHVVELLKEALGSLGKDLSNSRVFVMGYTYLENYDDTRNSPSEILVHVLEDSAAEVIVHDPYLPEYCGDIYERADGCDAVVLMVRHSDYLSIDLTKLKDILRTPILVDGRCAFNGDLARAVGLVYLAIGQGSSQS